MNKDDVLRILVGNGFKTVSVDPSPNYHLFTVERTDIFGARSRHSLAFAADEFSEGDIKWLEKSAARDGRSVVLVGESAHPTTLPVLSKDQFRDRLGGSVLSLLPLDPEYSARLVQLGRNDVPTGLSGDASDLFEEYVHAGLQFLLGSRVVRYGQDRRFEKVADGIVVGDSIPIILYDAKAYSKGYEVTADSVRQFASYVNDFNRRYGSRVGRVFSFPVISGKFVNGKASMESKSSDLRAEAENVGLCFITAGDLADIIKLAVQKPLLRKSVDWKKLFNRTALTPRLFADELKARELDQI